MANSFDQGSFDAQSFSNSSWDVGGVTGVVPANADFLATASIVANMSATCYAVASLTCDAKLKTTLPVDDILKDAAHLWTPYREVVVEPVSLRSSTRVKVVQPDVPHVVRIAAESPFTTTKIQSHVGFETPNTGVTPQAVRVRAQVKSVVLTPRGHANTGFVRAVSHGTVNVLPPIPSVFVMPVSARGKAYYAYYTPETVQNLTEEQIMSIF